MIIYLLCFNSLLTMFDYLFVIGKFNLMTKDEFENLLITNVIIILIMSALYFFN